MSKEDSHAAIRTKAKSIIWTTHVVESADAVQRISSYISLTPEAAPQPAGNQSPAMCYTHHPRGTHNPGSSNTSVFVKLRMGMW